MALSTAEQQELAGLQADPESSGSGGGLSSAEQAELHQLSGDPEANPQPGLASRAFSAVGTALDYPRSAIGSPALDRLASLMTGKPTTSEWGASGNPKSADILAKSGTPQGGHLSDIAPILFAPPGSAESQPWYSPTHWAAEKGGLFDVTPRGVAGGVLDMATDPITYASAGVNKAVQGVKAAGEEISPYLKALSAALNPASNATEAAGTKMYESGMAKQIAKGAQFGKDVSDTMYNKGLYGTSKMVAEKGDAAADALKAERDALMNAAQKKIDSTRAPYTPVVPKSTGFGPSPEAVNVTHAIQDPLATLGHEGTPDLFGGTIEPHVSPGENLRYTNEYGYDRESGIPEENLTQRMKFSKAGGEPASGPMNLGTEEKFPGEQQQLNFPDKTSLQASGPVQQGISHLSASTQKAFKPLIDHVNLLVSNARLTPEQGQTLIDKFVTDKATRVPNPTLQQLSQWKTDIYNGLPANAYDVSKDLKMSQGMGKVAAQGARDEVVNAANKAIPGVGDKINEVNDELGHLLTIQGVSDKQALKEGGERLITPNAGNHALTTGILTGNPVAAAGHVLGSTALKAFNDGRVRNTLGYMARKLGTGTVTAPVLDAAAMNTLKNMSNQQPVAGVGK